MEELIREVQEIYGRLASLEDDREEKLIKGESTETVDIELKFLRDRLKDILNNSKA